MPDANDWHVMASVPDIITVAQYVSSQKLGRFIIKCESLIILIYQ